MLKNICIFILFFICFHLIEVILCDVLLKDNNNSEAAALPSDVIKSVSNNLLEAFKPRTKRLHHLRKWYHLWGWHALAIAYLIKVKIVIVAFFVGSAIFLGLRYILPYKCQTDVVRETPHIVYPTPPFFQPNDHEHISYSFNHPSDFNDHHQYDDNSWSKNPTPFEPYGGYSDISSRSAAHGLRKKRNVIQKRDTATSTEESIGDFILKFLGLDSLACRRRFLCEVEFHSKVNSLTSMAFRVIGPSFFGKYINKYNKPRQANSFAECSLVNPACIFVENENSEESIITNEAEIIASDLDKHSQELFKSNEINSQNYKKTKLERVRNYYSGQLAKYDRLV
uniref:Uncharacterized protein n=1 Tax=Glossina brevipalpis TaxID=37001 RepID=A0A1A9WCF7_9MUSC